MDAAQHDTIRDRAYALWVEAGSPEGRDDEFWYEAERVLAEDGEVDSSAAKADVDLPPLVAGRLS